MPPVTTTRTVVALEELLAGATERVPLRREDGLSGVPMERLLVDGQPCVLKLTSPEIDWVARLWGDTGCRAARVWELGLYDAVAPYVDPLVVGVGYDEERALWGVLMRDATGEFLEEGAVPISVERQDGFLRDMTAMHAAFWGFEDPGGLCRPEQLYRAFSPSGLDREAERGPLTGVPAYAVTAWDGLVAALPGVGEQVRALADEPGPLVAALAQTPRTFVHHDWKGGNLGTRADGRTVLVDWAYPGANAGLADVAWYLANNCDRLTTSKEAVVEGYRAGLERAGITTAGWFERQLELALLGAFVIVGWSKTGDPVELAWWVDRIGGAAAELTR